MRVWLTYPGSPVPAEAPLAEGDQSILARIRDRAGNEATAQRAFHVDLTPPQVVIVEPGDQTWTNRATIDVRGGVIDASPVVVRVDGVDATIVNTEFTATGVPVGGADGSDVTLTAVATDAAGHVGQASLTLHVDRTPPAIVITAPSPGDYVAGPIVPVAGFVQDVSPVTVTLDGDVVPVGVGGQFSGQVEVADGATAISATAVDAAGNAAAAQVTVNVDSVAPQITIASPADGLITSAPQVEVAGTVADASPVTVLVNGVEVPVTSGAFAYAVALLGEGAMTLVVDATDAAGHTSSASVTVTADRTPPDLTITAPDPSVVIGSLPIVVSGTVFDLTETSVTVNGLVATRAQQGWQAAFPSLAEGAQPFTVVATDAAGNQTTLALEVVVDLSPPVVTITAPAPGTLTRESSIEVSGTVTDLSLQSVTVNGIPAVVAPNFSSASLQAFGVVPAIHLVAYDVATHAWHLVAANLPVTEDSVTASFESPVPSPESPLVGSYALVVADQMDPPILVPAVGDPLVGVAMVPLPVTATSTGTVDPASVPPAGGTALGTLVVDSPVALPSGTVVQTSVIETYSLASGQIASQEDRSQDLLLFRAPSTSHVARRT